MASKNPLSNLVGALGRDVHNFTQYGFEVVDNNAYEKYINPLSSFAARPTVLIQDAQGGVYGVYTTNDAKLFAVYRLYAKNEPLEVFDEALYWRILSMETWRDENGRDCSIFESEYYGQGFGTEEGSWTLSGIKISSVGVQETYTKGVLRASISYSPMENTIYEYKSGLLGGVILMVSYVQEGSDVALGGFSMVYTDPVDLVEVRRRLVDAGHEDIEDTGMSMSYKKTIVVPATQKDADSYVRALFTI